MGDANVGCLRGEGSGVSIRINVEGRVEVTKKEKHSTFHKGMVSAVRGVK